METWLPVVGYEGYYDVSSAGRIRRVGSAVLKTRDTGSYSTVTLSVRSVQRIVKVHQVVAHAFLGPRPGPSYEVCHADDDRRNNSVSNLRWDTHRNNMRDMVANGHGPQPRETCKRGLHAMTPENTIKNGGGRRLCRSCRATARELRWMKEEGA